MKTTDRSTNPRDALVLTLAIMLILGALCPGAVSLAQPNQRSYAVQDLARLYVDSGYAVVGPAGVVAMNTDTLTLRNPYKDMTLSLRGQTVVVMGPDARPLSTSAVVSGSNVYVFRKGLNTAVMVLPR
jgi:hypothetical protein